MGVWVHLSTCYADGQPVWKPLVRPGSPFEGGDSPLTSGLPLSVTSQKDQPQLGSPFLNSAKPLSGRWSADLGNANSSQRGLKAGCVMSPSPLSSLCLMATPAPTPPPRRERGQDLSLSRGGRPSWFCLSGLPG